MNYISHHVTIDWITKKSQSVVTSFPLTHDGLSLNLTENPPTLRGADVLRRRTRRPKQRQEEVHGAKPARVGIVGHEFLVRTA